MTLYQVLKAHPEPMSVNDRLVNELLISKRPNLHHLLLDEVLSLMDHMVEDFGNVIQKESIGKTYENRDMWMLKIDATDYFKHKGVHLNPDRKAILLTGAHHSRELVSVQMPLYTVLDMLHGLVHGREEAINLLKHNRYYVMPIVNVDGSYAIMNHYLQTGELMLKRKNNDRMYEDLQNPCPEAQQGVDINRNYGYLWGNPNGPCADDFPGPHAFSEPETKSMRSMLYKYHDDIKFVYNFHAFGPMYIWPYNAELDNELSTSNPEAQKIFNEIWDEATFPSSTLHGNAHMTVGYLANGEANDYITKTFDIPSVSPELANDNFFSSDFFLQHDHVVREVLRDNHPWILYTLKKLSGELSLEKGAHVQDASKTHKKYTFKVRNSGLQDWHLGQENYTMEIFNSKNHTIGHVKVPDIKARESAQLSFTYPSTHPLDFVTVVYNKYHTDSFPTVETINFDHAKVPMATSILNMLNL